MTFRCVPFLCIFFFVIDAHIFRVPCSVSSLMSSILRRTICLFSVDIFFLFKMLNKQCSYDNFHFYLFCPFFSSTFPLLIRINSVFIWYSDFVLCGSFFLSVIQLRRPFFLVSFVFTIKIMHTAVMDTQRSASCFFNENSNKLIMINLLYYIFTEAIWSFDFFPLVGVFQPSLLPFRLSPFSFLLLSFVT